MAFFDSAFIQYTAILFMFLSGTNYTVLYFGLTGKFNRVWRSDEFKAYAFSLVVIALLLAGPIYYYSGSGIEKAIRDSLFQVISFCLQG